jgi:NitT/TauT family transport system ATP-binding protein
VTELIDVPLPRPRTMDTLADPQLHAMANAIRAKVFSRNAHHA